MHRRKARQGGRVYVRETGAINWDGSQRRTLNESNNIEKERKARRERVKEEKSNLRLESGPLISSSRRWNRQKGRRFPPKATGRGNLRRVLAHFFWFLISFLGLPSFTRSSLALPLSYFDPHFFPFLFGACVESYFFRLAPSFHPSAKVHLDPFVSVCSY